MTEAALVEIPQLMTAIRQAVANGDYAKLRLAAHTLKGAVRYFGGCRACELAVKLENMGRMDDLVEPKAILAGLEDEIAQVMAMLADDSRPKNPGDFAG